MLVAKRKGRTFQTEVPFERPQTLLPPVDWIISNPQKIKRRLRDQYAPTGGPLPTPWRHEDYYRFGRLSSVE